MDNNTPYPLSGVTSELTPNEKARMIQVLLTHAEQNPLPRKQPHLVRSPFHFDRMSAAAFLLVVTLIVTTGAAYAAEEALPGDFLYPIKINVTEKVLGVFAGDTIAQAEWESQKAERRLEEAEILAARGRLNPETRQEIQNNIDQNFQAFSIFTQLLTSEGATSTEKARTAHVRFEAKIDAHSKILERLQNYTEGPQQIEVKHLELNVRKKAAEINEGKAQTLQSKPGTKFEAKKEEIVTLIQETREAFEARKEIPKVGLEKNIFDDGERSLEVAQRALIYAEIDSIDGNKDTAYSSLVDSERATEEALTHLNQLQRIRSQAGPGL